MDNLNNTVYFGDIGNLSPTGGWCVYAFSDEAMPELISAFSKVGVKVKREPSMEVGPKDKTWTLSR